MATQPEAGASADLRAQQFVCGGLLHGARAKGLWPGWTLELGRAGAGMTRLARGITLGSAPPHYPMAMKTVDQLPPASAERAHAGVSVLLVDDETAVRRFAARVLEREGYGVVQASDGAEALRLVRAEGVPVEIVVSDIVMPRLNGVQLMEALAASHPGLPVILMSGYAPAALSELGIAAPCSILTKPFPAERLLAEVKRCSRRGSKPAA